MITSRSELSVPELSHLIRGAIRGIPQTVLVRGPLVDLGRGYRGHIFASLREGGVGVRCFIHARVVARMPGPLAEGDTVVIHGRLSLYKSRGDIQLVADCVSLVDDSTRARQATVRIQVALEREGVLGANRRVQMPDLPRAIAVVGGHNSAAVLDIVTALHRRAPWVGIEMHPTRLQGDGAHLEIAAAINAAAASSADVIAVVRGGGANGDFAPFDRPEVCRAIAAAGVPVVTALGHEQDRRLADLAAHTAASTPSDAAHHIVPDARDLRAMIASARRNMAHALAQSIRAAEAARTSAATRLSTSAQLVTTRARARAERVCLDQRISRVAAALSARHIGARARLVQDVETIARRASVMRADMLRSRSQHATTLRARSGSMRRELDALRHRIHVAHPLNVVARGYVIARDHDGNVITGGEAALATGWLELQFGDRRVVVTVSNTPQP
jgi:exodeoxyribonuclease VII large subunit